MIDVNGNIRYREIWLGDRGVSELYYGEHRVWPDGDAPFEGDFRYAYKLLNGSSGMSECGTFDTFDNELFSAFNSETQLNDISKDITEFIVGSCIDKLSYTSTPNAMNFTSCHTYDFTRSNVKTLPRLFFNVLTYERTVILGNSFETIEGSAFESSSNLTKINLANVKNIGERAFAETELLSTITIPSSLETIGERCFYKSKILTSVDNFENCKVASIPNGCFSGCTRLENIKLGTSTRKIELNAFANTNLKSIDLSYVNELGIGCFSNCTNLKEVKLGENLYVLTQSSFSNCGLVDIKLPNSLTEIGFSCFFNNENMTSQITIHENVIKIGNNAFLNAPLDSVVIECKTPPVLEGNRAFSQVTATSGDDFTYPIYVPSESVDAYKSATNWSYYADRIFPIT